MRTITLEEKNEIWAAKKAWKHQNKNRTLYRCNDLVDIQLLIELSDYANNLLKKKIYLNL